MNKRDKNSRKYINPQLLIRSKAFQELVNTARQTWKIPKNGFKDLNKYEAWKIYQIRSLNFPSFLEDINTIRKEMNKTPHWSYFIYSYTTQGKVPTHYSLRSGRTPYIPRVKEGANSITLTIGPNTLLSDVRLIWSDVRKIQKTLPGHDSSRSRRTMKRDLEVLKFIDMGASISEIYQQLPDNLLTNYPDLDSVARNARRTKKKLNGQ